MGTILSETSSFDATITVPASGDARTAASVQAPFQKLTNRSKYLYDQLPNGLLVGGNRLDSSNGTTVNVSAIKAVLIAGALYSASAAAVTVSVLEGGGAFASNTWYYLYCYVSGGALAFQISTTVPEASLTWKTGATTHRYLGAFRTGAAAAILPFRAEDGEYVWAPQRYASNFTLVLTSGNQTSYTDVSLAHNAVALLPPHARVAKMRFKIKNTSGSDGGYYVRTNGDTTGEHYYFIPTATTSFDALSVEADSSGILEYKIEAAGVVLDAWVNGWRE